VSGDIVVNGTTYRQYDGEWFEVESEYRRRFLTPQEHAALVEIERLRAEVERLTDELQQVANEIALAESQEARRER
jgi:ribosomal protein L9